MSEQFLPPEQKTVDLVVEEALFNDPEYPYIGVENQLFQFNGAYYDKRTDQQEEKRIANFLATQKVINYRTGSHKYPYATTKNVTASLSWIKKRLTVNPDIINPPGINCKNGVLRLFFDESDVRWELVPHSPKIIYTYEPLVEYDPNAPTEQCDRMLQALDEPQRDIFLKIASSALDLSAVRKRIGRQIRVVFVLGSGRNGKDVLRLALTYLLGNVGVVSPSLMDFRDYDKGRRFGLANLQHALVVWSSENVRFIQIDNLQSLKAPIQI
jgi:putative DNA primase/helicase